MTLRLAPSPAGGAGWLGRACPASLGRPRRGFSASEMASSSSPVACGGGRRGNPQRGFPSGRARAQPEQWASTSSWAEAEPWHGPGQDANHASTCPPSGTAPHPFFKADGVGCPSQVGPYGKCCKAAPQLAERHSGPRHETAPARSFLPARPLLRVTAAPSCALESPRGPRRAGSHWVRGLHLSRPTARGRTIPPGRGPGGAAPCRTTGSNDGGRAGGWAGGDVVEGADEGVERGGARLRRGHGAGQQVEHVPQGTRRDTALRQRGDHVRGPARRIAGRRRAGGRGRLTVGEGRGAGKSKRGWAKGGLRANHAGQKARPAWGPEPGPGRPPASPGEPRVVTRTGPPGSSGLSRVGPSRAWSPGPSGARRPRTRAGDGNRVPRGMGKCAAAASGAAYAARDHGMARRLKDGPCSARRRLRRAAYRERGLAGEASLLHASGKGW